MQDLTPRYSPVAGNLQPPVYKIPGTRNLKSMNPFEFIYESWNSENLADRENAILTQD